MKYQQISAWKKVLFGKYFWYCFAYNIIYVYIYYIREDSYGKCSLLNEFMPLVSNHAMLLTKLATQRKLNIL